MIHKITEGGDLGCQAAKATGGERRGRPTANPRQKLI
jgi:hypothetical protein